MKRAGFTMIELIFVIVILGILAAVAVPKLAATRNDAKIAAEITSIGQAVQNFGAEYTAQGDYTNYVLADGNAAVKCVEFTGAGSDGNVTVTMVTAAAPCADPIHAKVKTKLTANGILGAAGVAKTYEFGGTGIKD